MVKAKTKPVKKITSAAMRRAKYQNKIARSRVFGSRVGSTIFEAPPRAESSFMQKYSNSNAMVHMPSGKGKFLNVTFSSWRQVQVYG